MNDITLEVTGDADLDFAGEKLAQSGDQEMNGPRSSRFNEVTVYKTTGGNFVVYEEYITYWQGEDITRKVFIYGSIEEVKSHFAERFDAYIKELLDDLGIPHVRKIE